MAEFFAELKRRQMFRVAAAYAVVAWLLLQLINNLTPALRLPEWASTLVVILLVVGFPIALLFCWIQHLPSADGSEPSAKMARLDWTLIGTLAVVLCFIGYQQIAPSSDATGRSSGVEAARSVAASPAGAIALAVLPFANLSGDPSQEFFSDGMTEEIAAALAKIPNLRLVGRLSLEDNEKKDIAGLRQAFNVSYLIGGSVRRDGDNVRITAQLVDAGNGSNVWTESYDRQLTSIFATQEDIARAIAGALRVPLGLNPGENLVNDRGIDPESYQQYLRAKALILARGQARLAEAAALLEQLVVRNPNYAPAWALLAQDYSLMPIFHPERDRNPTEFRRVVDQLLGKAESAAQRAVALDPNNAPGYVTLGYLQFVRGKLLAAEDRAKQALALDPASSLQGYSLLLAEVGRLKEANALKRQLQALEPFVPLYNSTTARWLWVEGQNDDAAIAILKALPPGSGVGSLPGLAMIYASLGRYGEAADLLENLPAEDVAEPFAKDAARLLRTAPARAVAPQSLPSLGGLEWVYLHVGAPERALENYERNVERGFAGGAGLPNIWHASWAPVRKTERFKAYVRARGLVDYWRVRGWPQWCHPTTGDDFDCT